MSSLPSASTSKAEAPSMYGTPAGLALVSTGGVGQLAAERGSVGTSARKRVAACWFQKTSCGLPVPRKSPKTWSWCWFLPPVLMTRRLQGVCLST
jgi:hypothetical protein